MAETYTLYKLIVLYMLDRVDFPLATSQISEFILDKGYTSYFKLQETLSELISSDLLKAETRRSISSATKYLPPSGRRSMIFSKRNSMT